MPFLHEANLNLRAEGFDLLNHPQLGVPNAVIGNPLYGRISSAGNPRQVQLAARITF